ncbi:hypothetical protein TBLA_0B07160 [Henningerozyma blattae CBS 6284]|uniref:ubiquitinyl hydrolase 1 n=1 Tax=Henningerozyma blattae (strain ATCC 34711 / CBS 6284 / DSM 70876 / NBRC 10599 / NRRL Y-10934 / UCD 77-7) TaxID=1071380 RepID=I2GZI1_HENB6|nr:hypothetical protein TBLA_0B07160 [Tetrapisispora blattae CBS 6284]CCH59533.1 hypothetical protein TBLA_0B07160 [Tetrapisispora blattae CBS 6284]
MIDEKNQDVVLGYAQQDAQEFFQAILAKLEKNVKQIEHIPLKEKNKSNQNNILKSIPFEKLPSDALLGHDHLDKVGTVFIPTDQINPNLIKNNESINSSNTNQLFTPFKLITPLDGIIAERIGCLNCGENGGIRYSVSSSLSLNLPNYTNDSISLYELLSNYTQPEIIEQVNCNRCTLASMYDSINSKLKELTSEDVNINQIDNNTQEDENSTIEKTSMAINDSNNKLKSVLTERLNTISNVLSKPVIDDDSFKTLSTSNMTCQTSKSKQLLISRPPPLLSIHINRSVFDPTTYQIRKNNSRVLFESRLNLNGFCCNIDEINLDARLPMNKRDVTPDEKINESSELLPTPSNSQTPSADFLDSKNEKYLIQIQMNYLMMMMMMK